VPGSLRARVEKLPVVGEVNVTVVEVVNSRKEVFTKINVAVFRPVLV
jgi:hypothetical protein